MEIKMKFTGKFRELEELLSYLRYKYDGSEYELEVDCDINVTQIKKEIVIEKNEEVKKDDFDILE